MTISFVNSPPRDTSSAHYLTNRQPLSPQPLVKLRLGSVKPGGWLRHQLDLMVEGMTGRLGEVSAFLRPENGWFGGDEEGWEEQPYWFRGFHDLAVLTGDKRLLAEAARWIEAVLGSQRPDGYFGATYHKSRVGKNGQDVCDLWPHMVMLDAVISHHERTGDERVIPFMTRFFEFCAALPEGSFVPTIGPEYGDWKPDVQRWRATDMVPHIYWLFNQTGDTTLLDLATRFYQHTMPPEDEWLDRHVVNLAQRFSYPAIYFQQSRQAWHLEATEFWYAQHLATWGQQPRGIFGADERVRPGKVDPRQGFETCGMTEFAKSFYMLGRISGDPVWADRCEDVMLNHFPAAQTPDLRALHYLTAANQPQLDSSENHDYYNKGRQIDYSPHLYRCCQHNVAMGWPWYAKNLWQASADNGLVAWLYAECDVTAKVGQSGAEVTIREKTGYPFDGMVTLTVTENGGRFPLYLRVPRWCEGFEVTVNRERLATAPSPGQYVRIERDWQAGDTVQIAMPMAISITQWPRTGAVTVDRGPLSYSVKIGEDWRRCGGTDEWPEWEVFPTTPWAWGLVLDRTSPAASIAVRATRSIEPQPWTVEAAPIELSARARPIPGWGLTDETVDPLQVSPIRSDEPEQEITLIPLGCARLRMSCLPVTGEGPEAREWKPGYAGPGPSV